MRRACIGVGLLLAASFGVALFAPQTHGQPAPGGAAADTHRKITVTGTGTVAVKPDTARVSFAVKGTGADFKAAVADCDKKAEAVKKAVADLKLGGLEVKFGPINLLPANGGLGGGGPAGGFGSAPGGGIGGHTAFGGIQGVPSGPGGAGPTGRPVLAVEVTRTFTVVASFGGKESAGELKDIVTVSDKTLAAAMAAGATEPPTFNNASSGGYGFAGGQLGIGGGLGNSRIEFARSSYSGLRQDALKLAVADAVTNAKAAAGVANLTAKDIVSLSDQMQFNGFGPTGVPTNSGRGEVLGEQELTVQVIVTFSY